MTAAAWTMAAVLLAVAVVLEVRERRAAKRARVSRRCQVPPLPPQTNVVRLPPTGLGGVR